MAEINDSLPQNDETLKSLRLSLDSKSLTLTQFSDSKKPDEPFSVLRGPKYKEYSDLRDKRLRTKNHSARGIPFPEMCTVGNLENHSVLTPPKKQVKFSPNISAATPPRRPNNKANPDSIVARSVPDFLSLLRKENRRPVTRSPLNGKPSSVTPPATKSGKMYGKMVGGGSKSTNSDEKRSGGAVVRSRRSYANVEELKVLARDAGNAIVNGGGGVRKSAVFGFSRQV